MSGASFQGHKQTDYSSSSDYITTYVVVIINNSSSSKVNEILEKEVLKLTTLKI